MSRAPVTRLLAMYVPGEEVEAEAVSAAPLPVAVHAGRYWFAGPATQKILLREYHDFGNPVYQRLARLSVSQLYRLRQGSVYRQRRVAYQRTRPTQVAIGQRRRPQPNGCPGYLRVDTLQQGDRDLAKGVYHINAVDEVTQWQGGGGCGAHRRGPTCCQC